jgi:hypothetical protein
VHTLAISVHAASGLVAFAIGLVLILQVDSRPVLGLAQALPVFVTLLELSMLLAIATHWARLDNITRAIFAGLAALGLYMVWRSIQALRRLQGPHGDPVGVIDDAGFVLISLLIGFVIVSALDLQAPWWAIVTGALAAFLLGRYFVIRKKRQIRTGA